MNIAEQLSLFQKHLDGAKELFVGYIHEVLKNENNKYWTEENWSLIKGFRLSYDFNYLNFYFASCDWEMEECEEEEETSFFLELYNEKMNRDPDRDFMPDELPSAEADMPVYDLLETWMIACFREALPENFNLPCFVGPIDSAYYTCIQDGHKGDHLYVLELLDPNAVDDEQVGESGFTILENRKHKYAVKNPEDIMITDFVYDFVDDFDGEFAQAVLEGKSGFIDKKGNFTEGEVG